MKLVVGLGNPGAEYRETRHNVGFQVVDELARRWGIDQWRESFESLAAKTVRGDAPVLLAKPLTFMNLSGRSVAGLAGFYKMTPATCWSSPTTWRCRWGGCGRDAGGATVATTASGR